MKTSVRVLAFYLFLKSNERILPQKLKQHKTMKIKFPVLATCFILATGLFLSGCNNDTAGLPQADISQPSPTPVEPTNTFTPTLIPTSTLTPTLTQTLAPPLSTSVITYTNPQNYEVIFKTKGTNTNFRITRILVYLPAPIEWNEQKNVVIEEIFPEPDEQIVDPTYGNGLVYWNSIDVLPTGENSYFTLRFSFTAYETKTFIQPETIQPYDTESELYKLYTREERFIEMSDPVIRNMAEEAAGDETNPYLLARRFYDYILDNFSYRLYSEGLLGAKEFCIRGQGECGDYSSLFIAFCRLKGIPARSVVGYWAISGLDQTHVWAEFYLEGIGWIPVDPSIGENSSAARDYYFGNMDNQRVILHKGFNIPLQGAPNNYQAPLIQLPQYWFWGSEGDASTVRIERSEWTVSKP